jgi:hypothetical protein
MNLCGRHRAEERRQICDRGGPVLCQDRAEFLCPPAQGLAADLVLAGALALPGPVGAVCTLVITYTSGGHRDDHSENSELGSLHLILIGCSSVAAGAERQEWRPLTR